MNQTGASPAPRRILGQLAAGAVEAVLAAVVATAALVFSLPAARQLTGGALFADAHPPLNLGDLGGTLFLVARAMAGERGDSTALMGFPLVDGTLIEFPNTLFTDGVAALAQRFGLVDGYNLAMVLVLVSNGLALHLAARLTGLGRAPALVAAALGAALPMVADELLRGRPVTAWWAPALLASALCAASVRSWRHLLLVVPGGLLLGLAIRTYALAPVLLLPWTVAMGLRALGRPTPGGLLRAGLGLLVATGLAWPAIRDTLAQASLTEFGVGASPKDALAPASLFNVTMGTHARTTLPSSLSVLAASASLLGWRRAALWAPPLAVGALLLGVALGPDPSGGPSVYGAVMDLVPQLQAAPRPSRYALPGALMAALWLAGALAAATRRWPRPVAALACAGAAAFVLVQGRLLYTPPLQPWPHVDLPALLADEQTLLDLPLLFEESQSQLALVAALPVRRLNPMRAELLDWVRSAQQGDRPLLRAAGAIATDHPPDLDAVRAHADGALERRALGLRYLVYHPHAPPKDQRARWRALLEASGATLVVKTPRLEVYELPDGS